MRYQALILLLVILLSSYLFRQTTVFSDSNAQESMVTKATVIDTVRTDNSEVPAPKQDTSSNAATVPAPAVSSDAYLQSAPASTPTPPPVTTVVAQPIIEEATSSASESCIPVQARNYLVEPIDGNVSLYSKNEYNRWPIASVTKLMTAVIVLENLQHSAIIQVTPEIQQETGGYSSLPVGASYTVDDLLKALLTVSSNDAAYALAESFGKDAFVKKMNDKAKELSMSQTSYYEPSGLSYLNQSTAHDMFILAVYIYKHYPTIFSITRQRQATIRDAKTGKRLTLSNINEFAGRSDFFGGKTGYIDQSGGNLISLFNKNGRMIYVGVLGSPDRFNESSDLISCVQ